MIACFATYDNRVYKSKPYDKNIHTINKSTFFFFHLSSLYFFLLCFASRSSAGKGAKHLIDKRRIADKNFGDRKRPRNRNATHEVVYHRSRHTVIS